jgi:hypothetical protein
VQRLVERIQHSFPASRTGLRLFVAGSPVATCCDLLGVGAFDEPVLRTTALRAAMDLVRDRARAIGGGFVVVKELPQRLLAGAQAAWGPHVAFYESLPTTFVGLSAPGMQTYQERLRAKYRVLMKRRQRSFEEAGLRWQVEYDFARHADAMHGLYLQVLMRSAHRFERLTPEFFRQVARQLERRAFALLCYRGERLVAFELFLGDDQWLHPIYLGIDYGVRDDSALYFNALYRILEEVERRGYPVVQLGQTSYEIKAALGAVGSRLYLAVNHPNPVVQRMIRSVGGHLFPPVSLLARRPIDWESARVVSTGVG